MPYISASALVARINRKLRPDGQMLRKTRGDRSRMDLGSFWVQEISRNLCLDTFVDPETFGREIGVLGEHEHVIEPE